MFSENKSQKSNTNRTQIQKSNFGEAEGVRRSIRLQKLASMLEILGRTVARGPETDQNRPKSPKIDQKT